MNVCSHQDNPLNTNPMKAEKISKTPSPDPENDRVVVNDETSQFTDPLYDENGVPYQERTTPNVTTQEQPTQEAPIVDRSRSDKLVKDLFSIRMPEPTLDEDRLNRINRMGKLNTVGKGIGVLGNILSLALGANVRKSDPDTQTPELMRQYQATLDKFKNDQDSYKIKDFARAREDAQFGVTYEMRKEAQALQEAQLKARTAEARERAKEKEAMFYAGLDDKQKDRLSKENIAKGNQRIRMDTYNKSRSPLMIMTSSGTRYALSPEEFSFLTNEANGNETVLNDPKYSKWFDRVPITKQVPNKRFGGYDKVPTGEYTYKLKRTADKYALAQAVLQLHEDGKISLPGRKDQPKADTGSPVPPVPGTVTGPAVGRWAPQPSTNKAVPKMFQSNPDFGNDNVPKKQYSTGGLY